MISLSEMAKLADSIPKIDHRPFRMSKATWESMKHMIPIAPTEASVLRKFDSINVVFDNSLRYGQVERGRKITASI